MLLKQHRLQKTKDIHAVFQKGKGVRGQGLFMKVKETKSPHTRIAVVVSKKVARLATQRNRLKRLMREATKQQKIKEGFDVVIIALPGIKMNNIKEAKLQLGELFKKASLLE